MSKLNELAFKVADNEVGSVQLSIRDIKEVLKCVAMEIYLNPSTGDMLHEVGMEFIEVERSPV